MGVRVVPFPGLFQGQIHYNGLIPFDPEDSSLLLPMALVSAQDGDFPKALQLVDRVLQVNANDRWLDVSDMAALLKANLLIITGETEKGNSLADKILGETRKDEMKYFGYTVKSKYYEKKGDYSTALEMLGKAEVIGGTADLYFRKALLYAKMGNFKEALRSLGKARDMNPSEPRYGELSDRLKKLSDE
jgi:tetratricopeptide (TPR) repeat protein